ncbi:MAG: bifunctional adenosylcobinamide kinase/adenosylcobinamide-phosphate guanylyltransferase [Mycobacterium sp.]|nr:bifunctional adenosylcobinamide kinase/adenosylcobinamide-phosphate guanylyltransferase [Mycobacterium sp.]
MRKSAEHRADSRTLVLGGIRSGKSAWAESTLTEMAGVRYIATGPVADHEQSWTQRISEHRSRRPSDWCTVETGDVAGELRAHPGQPTLVDDLGGWLTRVLDGRGWDGSGADDDVDELAGAVETFTAPLVLVSPEVGLSVVAPTAAGRLFTDELGRLNQRLAGLCDQVVLVVAGQPLWVKSAAGSGGEH